MPSLTDLEQFLVTGLSLGGVYALSGIGMVVLYRATGVLNSQCNRIKVSKAFTQHAGVAWLILRRLP